MRNRNDDLTMINTLSTSTHKCYRHFSTSLVASVTRKKELNPLPFQSHLSSATVQHRRQNASGSQGNEKEGEIVEESTSTKEGVGKNPIGVPTIGRVKRTHIKKLNPSEKKLLAVGGRLIREAPKTTSKLSSTGGSVAATMSGTAKYRQQNINRLGAASIPDSRKKSNPSSISIDSSTSIDPSRKKEENKTTNDNTDKKSRSVLPTAMLVCGSASGLLYFGSSVVTTWVDAF